MDLIGEVEELAERDGSVSRWEHRFIDFLKLTLVPLFLFEVIVYGAVMAITVDKWNVVIYDKVVASAEGKLDYYCTEGIFSLMILICGLYTIVFAFRITVVVGAFVGRDAAEAQAGINEVEQGDVSIVA